MARYRDLKAELDAAVGFLTPELREAGRDRVAALVDETPELDGHRAHLDRLLAGADHALSPATESALGELGPTLEAGSGAGRAIAEGDVETPTVEAPDGGTETVTGTATARLLRSRDRAFRETVFERRRDALAAHRHGMAAAYVERIRADVRLARLRGFDSALHRRLEGRFPVAAYDTVIDGIADRLDPYHRLLAARSAVTAGDELREWDVHVPLVDGDPRRYRTGRRRS
ncbi:M3 family metallopeptidase [Halobaculum litoreum]|uniref:M3 family metallopeptidase n=1 Tax=Halobaculum litoreum TaxID=3031998 RepID=A0ABD5XV64_9EURY